MSEIRTKLLSLSVLAMAFAGLSYGQIGTGTVIGGCSNTTGLDFATGTIITGNQSLTLRQEGETELVGDSVTQCTTSAGTNTTGSVTATLSATVTSKVETQTATYAGNSDAILIVSAPCGVAAGQDGLACTGAAVAGTYQIYNPVLVNAVAVTSAGIYPGFASGASITFAGTAGGPVAFPANGVPFTLTIANVRVNAATATNPTITESVQVAYNTTLSQTGQPLTTTPAAGAEVVGFATTSLKTQLWLNGGTSPFFFTGAAGASAIPTCTGNPVSGIATVAEAAAFTVQITEVLSNAFRTQQGENGSWILAAGGLPGTTVAGTGNSVIGIGGATQGTELTVTLGNMPSAALVYLPLSFTTGNTTFTLTGAGLTAIASPPALALIANGVIQIPVSGNTASATYLVTANNPATAAAGTNFFLPVFVNLPAGGLAPVQSTAMTVAVTYAPAATTAVAAPVATIPTFAPSTATPFNTLTVSACATTLLFPFVTNATGFETGIAIANMTTDNLKNETPTTAGTSSASPASGSCLLTFYGNVATQPAAFPTPTLSATTPVYANTLTSMAVPGFTGYAIAYCNFNDAHGFAYIVDNFGQSSGTAEGYTANVIVGNNRGGADGGLGQ